MFKKYYKKYNNKKIKNNLNKIIYKPQLKKIIQLNNPIYY